MVHVAERQHTHTKLAKKIYTYSSKFADEADVAERCRAEGPNLGVLYATTKKLKILCKIIQK